MQQTPYWPFLLIAGFIAFAEGLVSPIWIWNVAPVAIGYFLLRAARRKWVHAKPEMAFVIASSGLLLAGHAEWKFDWNGTATGSSTSALGLLFLPIYAGILGAIAFGVTRLFTRRVAHRCET